MSTDPRVVFITNARLSYPNLVVPQKQKGDDGVERDKYNCSLLIEPTSPDWQKFIARVTELATEQWKEHANVVLQRVYADRKARCFSQGEEHINNTTMQVREGYAGKLVISCTSQRQPQAIDGAGNPVDPTNTMAIQQTLRKLYGGCRVNAAVRPWAQQNKHGNAIRCDLIAIQFAKDDTPFGESAPDVSGLFGVTEQQAPAAPGMAPGFLTPGAPAPAAPGFGAPAGLPVMPPFPGVR